ncbi:hypothetical protein BB560_004706 [Smittium megazygosporum]|uniref:Major facilitator superfamily (MFS) profile domain-containing protein n=1 Tax=Smittium megazygosporum TaxID=133381 RepID=A0A2T9Z8H1_9FUNG|nr:hypothetical protein BB560_004706 [Smittium megazygosporum]
MTSGSYSDQEKHPQKEEFQVNVLQELTEDEKIICTRARRKIDTRILPIVVIIYISALIDRSNIGAALANGLKDGLKLSNGETANVTSIFYIFYIICEVPSNILLKKFNPHTWFGFIGTAWSVTCILLAFANSGTTFIIARSFLGVFEAGLTPGVVSYLSYWYTRNEVSYRMTLFFCAVPIAGVIGNPFAAALTGIKVGKLHKFQSIFLFEGLITLVISIVAFFIIKDYPDQAKFFTPQEHELVVRRLRADQGMASKAKATFKETLEVLLDWKVWAFCQIYFGVNNAYTVLSIFSPTMIKNLGYKGTTATYMAAIPNFCGLLGCVIVLYFLNRIKYTFLLFAFGIVTIVGYLVAAYVSGVAIKIIFLSVAGLGSIPNIPVLISWMSVNQGGIYKGTIASALVVSYSSICGAVSPHFFTDNLAPKYTAGNLFCTCMYGLSLLLATVLFFYFRAQNKHREENPMDLSHLSEEEQRRMNDKHPLFRYKL